MADDVEITFGANISKLVEGVSQVKDQLNSVRESTDKITESAKSMLDVFGIGLSFAGVVEFIKSMSELGEQLVQTSDRLGLTTQATVVLSGMAKITGGNLDTVAASIERMSLNIQRANTNAIDPAAQALKVLGLSAKDLVGVPTSEYIEKLHDAVSKFNPSLNLSNALVQIGGRGIAQMQTILRTGGEEWEQYKKQITSATEGLAAASPGMDDTSTKIGLLSLSVQSFGSRLFTVLKPAIDSIITSLTNWIQSLDSAKIMGAVQRIADGVMTIMSAVGTFAISVMGLIDQLGDHMDTFSNKAKGALAGIAGGAIGGSALGPGGTVAGGILGGLAGWYTTEYLGAVSAADEGNAKIKERLRTLGEILLKFKTLMTSYTDQINGKGAEGAKGTGQDAAALDLNIGAKINAQAAGIDAQIAALQQQANRQKQLYEFDADTFQVTQSQKTQLLLASLDQQYQGEKNLDQQKLAIYAGQPEKYAEVLKSLKALDEQYKTERLKLTLDGIKAQQAAWTEFSTSLQSSFNAQLRGLLAGTTSFKQAFKTIVGDMIIFFIEQIEKMVLQWIIGNTAMSTAKKAAAVQDVATAAAGNAAQNATLLGAIQARVGEVYAGVAAFFAPTLGPGAPAAAAPVAAAVDATATSMVAAGTAEQGEYEVGGGLYVLHPKETVLPAPAAQAFRDMAEGGGAFGGGGGVHFHGMLIDGPSLSRLFRDNAALMAKVLNGNLSRA